MQTSDPNPVLEAIFDGADSIESNDVPAAIGQALTARLGTTEYPGKITSVGRIVTGEHLVTFVAKGGGGYGSVWPEPLYEIARDAFLKSREIMVSASGNPIGKNIVFAVVTDNPA